MTRSIGFRKLIWSISNFIRLLNHHKNVNFPAKSTCHISRAITPCCHSGTSYTIYGYDSLTYSEDVVQVSMFCPFLPYQKLMLPVYTHAAAQRLPSNGVHARGHVTLSTSIGNHRQSIALPFSRKRKCNALPMDVDRVTWPLAQTPFLPYKSCT